MKSTIYNINALLLLLLMMSTASCTHDVDGLDSATYPTTSDVFIDSFTGDLQYSAFGGSDVKAFDVDKEVKYKGTASMKIAVPAANDPNGTYAGGVYYSTTGRDLSGYNCLTFWIKATKSASIDILGFGNDLGKNAYQVSISGLAVNTNWKKCYIPIPDPSKLNGQKGMFFYSEGPENGEGYTFWIDEVKFENLGTIAHAQPKIFAGKDKTTDAYNGVTFSVDSLYETFSLPNATDETVSVAPAYFTFASSNTSVATVDAAGSGTVVGGGSAVITGSIAGVTAKGSLSVTSSGAFVHAPTPTFAASDVISLYSDAYTNHNVDYFNGHWAPYQTTESAEFTVDNDHIMNYTNFNFVGNGFANPTVDATNMSYLHFDVFVPKGTTAGKLKITVRDYGAGGTYDGGDDATVIQEFTNLTAGAWNGLDVSLKGLSTKAHIGQIVYENDGSSLSNFYLDNVFFYKMSDVPSVAAPTPTVDASKVISIFSDAYTNLSGTDFFPNWGQSTKVTYPLIAGNKTLLYSGLTYQGTQFANTDVSKKTYLHVDYYTASCSSLRIFLISPGKETSYSLTVPSKANWTSVDIPLTTFSSVVDLTNVFQFKIQDMDNGASGQGNVYFDNLYFY